MTSSDDTAATSSSTTAGATTSEDSTGDTASPATSSTGDPAEPSVTVELVTDQNRAYVEMHGGWGPHLRAPMEATDGSLWLAYDGGPSVLANTTIHYARRDEGGWSTVASQAHLPGVQQNAAHLMRGALVMTYAVNVGSSQLQECYFDTTDFGYAACNTIQIGGPYSTPPNSNYVGAAIGPSSETVVWFTVVGAAGGTGQLVYTYDYGGGWNGPVATTLPGYNDYAYVRASFRGPSTLAIVGQAYVGAYPDGEYAIGVDELSFGALATLETLGPAAGLEVHSGADIWIDPGTGDTHVLARLGPDMGYWVLPSGAAWADHLLPDATLAATSRARLLYEDGGPLVMVAADGGGLSARWADAGALVDWAAAPVLPIEIPVEGFDAPSAIYAAGPEYQTAPVTGLRFAVCGQYGVADEQIWYGQLDLRGAS